MGGRCCFFPAGTILWSVDVDRDLDEECTLKDCDQEDGHTDTD